MRSHAATHDKVRPFQCELCSKKFSRKSGLKKHVKQVHTPKQVFARATREGRGEVVGEGSGFGGIGDSLESGDVVNSDVVINNSDVLNSGEVINSGEMVDSNETENSTKFENGTNLNSGSSMGITEAELPKLSNFSMQNLMK